MSDTSTAIETAQASTLDVGSRQVHDGLKRLNGVIWELTKLAWMLVLLVLGAAIAHGAITGALAGVM